MKRLTLIALLLLTALPALALADLGANAGPNYDQNPGITSAKGIFEAISKITDWIFSLFLIIAVIIILYGAFQLLISGGNAEALSASKKLVIYAAISVAIAVLAKSIILVAANIVGVKDLNL